VVDGEAMRRSGDSRPEKKWGRRSYDPRSWLDYALRTYGLPGFGFVAMVGLVVYMVKWQSGEADKQRVERGEFVAAVKEQTHALRSLADTLQSDREANAAFRALLIDRVTRSYPAFEPAQPQPPRRPQ
jgi:hypothetical protein